MSIRKRTLRQSGFVYSNNAANANARRKAADSLSGLSDGVFLTAPQAKSHL